MNFKRAAAANDYLDMFGDDMDEDLLDLARDMTDEEFDNAAGGVDEDGEYIDTPFSAGQWNCIDQNRY